MAYRTITRSGSYDDITVDMLGVARALAEAMGGRDAQCSDTNHSAQFRLGDDIVTLWRAHSDRNVRAQVKPADLTYDELRDCSFTYNAHEAKFDPDGRSMSAIGKDVMRRVVVPMQPSMSEARVRTKAWKQAAEDTARAVEASKALGISFSEHGLRDKYRVALHKVAGVDGIDGWVTSSGIELRLPRVSQDKAARILAILREA